MFAPELSDVAYTVNMLSAMASAFTVAFTFWITTHFAKKIIKPENGTGAFFAVLGSGVIAALSINFL
jgi:CBS-domain-containing membrane protein